MAFDLVKAEIDSLLAKLADASPDRQELEFKLREKLNELKAYGQPLPDDLVRLEALLDQQLSAESLLATRRDREE